MRRLPASTRRRLGLALGAAVIVALPAALPRPAAAADPGSESQLLAAINGARQGAGLGPLAVNGTLVAEARAWADHLMAAGALSHNPALGSQAPAGWSRVGEDVGFGPSASAVFNAFMASAVHRANILGDYEAVGVGADRRSDGQVFVTVDFLKWAGTPPAATAPPAPTAGPVVRVAAAAAAPPVPVVACTNTNPASVPSPHGATGYYWLGGDGGVFAFGQANYLGSLPSAGIATRAAAMAVTPTRQGYWILGNQGGVYSFGDAVYHGSPSSLPGGVTAVDIASTPGGRGYWVLGADGSVFSYGDAVYQGSLPGIGQTDQAVKLTPTASGNGYWILGRDGSVFSFGDAVFHGAVPASMIGSASSMAATATGDGYWITSADGSVFSLGDALYHGSVPGLGCQHAAGAQIVSTADGGGYYILSGDGRLFPFGDAPALGSPGGMVGPATGLEVVGAAPYDLHRIA